jgi:hypothetical protein
MELIPISMTFLSTYNNLRAIIMCNIIHQSIKQLSGSRLDRILTMVYVVQNYLASFGLCD